MKNENTEKVFVKAKLINNADRNSNCVVALRTAGCDYIHELPCASYDIYDEKPNTERILRALEHKCNDMIANTSDYEEKSLIAKIYSDFVEVVKFHQ